MKVTLAKTAGFCFGVRRAVEMAEAAAAKQSGRKVYTFGPLIHNAHMIKALEEKNIYTLPEGVLPQKGDTVILRAHGVTQEEAAAISGQGCTVIDATCPFVSKIHRIVEEEVSKGRKVLIVGDAAHPEVRGIASRAGACAAVQTEEEICRFMDNYSSLPLSVVCQTTFSVKNYDDIVKKIKTTCNDVHFFDTICKATQMRQSEAVEGALESDGVIVIGDKQSSNSKSLYQLCLGLNARAVFVEDAGQLDRNDFAGCKKLFITASASTPDSIIKEVNSKMSDVTNNPNAESFEELLEQSLKTLHTGEKVSGIITQINNNDIHVDLGVKQAGYITLAELSDDPNFDIAANIKVGDEIEAYVMRVNDVEGLIMLSKRRLDAVKNWEKLEAAAESKEALEGVIIDQNKGGVIASVLGVRVFIPASQTGLPREASFDSLMKTTHKIRITETNRQRRRVVGSIKALQADSRRESSAKVWETIAVGDKFAGIVKSFTTYGAFVDIGGVDGMVHISELAWNRVKHPSDVLQIGQQVNVYVLALDPEKRKISLGYRLAAENPWTKFVQTYKKGDVVNVKIVKFMPFGAFAEVMPGVDGLIHISQITDSRRIGKPEEALKLDQKVDVLITDIDTDKKKISLSIKALLDPAAMADAASEEEAPEAPVEE